MRAVASYQTSAALTVAAQHKINDNAKSALRVTFRAVGLAIEL
jgi:hypothetical protein